MREHTYSFEVDGTPEEAWAVEQKAGAKVRSRESKIWLARKGTNLLGVLVLGHVFGKHDLIDYAVALSHEGKVLQVEILEYREHYGSEIRAPKCDRRSRVRNPAYDAAGARTSLG